MTASQGIPEDLAARAESRQATQAVFRHQPTPELPDEPGELSAEEIAKLLETIQQLQATIAALQEQLAQLRGTADQQTETIDVQQTLIDKLKHDLDWFRRRLFGQRRERHVDDPRQQRLFGDEADGEPSPLETGLAAPEEEEPGPAKPKRRGHGRRRLPKDLPQVDVIHDLPEEERGCPCCGEPRVKVSEEISYQYEYQPAVLIAYRHIRYTYACQGECCEGHMTTAPKPPQPIEKGLAGPGLLAFVVTSKLSDHLPLNRQEDILTRHGIHFSRSTLCDWMARLGELVEPLYKLMVQRVLESKVLGADDTTVPLQDRNFQRTLTARFWAYVGDDAHPYVCFDFTLTRERDGPEKFLQGFEGYLQGDAYAGFVELARDSLGSILHVGCWAHARRKFVEAQNSAPQRLVHEALAYIQRLYDVEDEAASMSSEERLALRQAKSVPLLNRFQEWLKQQQDRLLPSSPLAEAVGYALNQWESLCLYTTDGDLPIDNNRTERVIRVPVIGRNNWLFVGSPKGGKTAAVLYTLVVTCKRLRIEPFAYLRDVFERLPCLPPDSPELEELLPDRWIAAHPEHRLVYREEEAAQAAARRRERRAERRAKAAAAAREMASATAAE